MRQVPGQSLLTNNFPLLESIDKVLAKKDDLINSLSAYCKELIKEKENNIVARRENMSHLLKILVDSAQKNCVRRKDQDGPRNGNRYDDENALFGVYTFLTAGRKFYEMLQANVPDSLPSISNVEKYVAKNSHLVQEGVFYFKECRQFLASRHLPFKVGLCEDGTVMKPNFKYNSKTNLIVGPVMPLVDGLPVPNAFPATSAALIANHYVTSALATIAYVVMVQPLAVSAPPFCLAIFGTNNSFTAEDVMQRKLFMVRGLKAEGIDVVFWGADGDPKVLKTQRAETFPLSPAVPAQFKEFYFADTSVGPTAIQDPIHLLNRFKTRILKPSIVLPMGLHVVSAGHLKTVIKTESKAEHGLTEHDLSKRDKMNFAATVKICSERTSKALQENVSGCEATLIYLELMRKFQLAFLDPLLSPLERIYNVWFTIGFVRIWRNWLLRSKKFNTSDNFITSSMQIGLEIDGHGLIKIMRYLRDEKCEELFLPTLFGSQTNESFFRKARSTGTTECLRINFDMLEFLHVIKRIEFLMEVSCKLSKVLKIPRERRVVLIDESDGAVIPTEPLPWDEEIRAAVLSAFEDASSTARKLGMHVNSTLSTKLGSILSLDIDNDQDENEDENVMEFEQENDADLDEDIPLDILRAFSAVAPSELDLSQVQSCSLTPDQDLPPSSKYVCFKDVKGIVRVLLKSTLCWLLKSEGFRISSDRLARCKTEVLVPRQRLLSHPRVEEVKFHKEVSVGDFCIFKKQRSKKFVIVQVLSFQYLSGKCKSFSLDVAPTEAPAKGARGLGARGPSLDDFVYNE